VAEEEYLAVAEWLYPRYEKRLQLLGAVDFEGLLLLPLQLFRDHPTSLIEVQKQTRFLMVDEFQDTNALQMQLIEKLVRPLSNLAVVGDDDQSIYGWRGAVIQNILSFPKQFHRGGTNQDLLCKVVKLEKNYRSTPAIVAVANSVIEKMNIVMEKFYKPKRPKKLPYLKFFSVKPKKKSVSLSFNRCGILLD
jgi:superfamily I DNA/RNA helicase